MAFNNSKSVILEETTMSYLGFWGTPDLQQLRSEATVCYEITLHVFRTPLLAHLLLYSYEKEFLDHMIRSDQKWPQEIGQVI